MFYEAVTVSGQNRKMNSEIIVTCNHRKEFIFRSKAEALVQLKKLINSAPKKCSNYFEENKDFLFQAL